MKRWGIAGMSGEGVREDLNIIVKMRFGSHLYGTSTPDSDEDYKGVFLPSKREMLLGNIPKSYSDSRKKEEGEKNTPDDTDMEIYSLHYFIKLACEGQTVALDMLHAPVSMLLKSSPIWCDIVCNRHRFYTKSLKAFIGYARRQASKYGVKGSRLNEAKAVMSYIEPIADGQRLEMFWDMLPTGEHVHKLDKNANGLREYQVCGKRFQETARVEYVLPILKRFYDNYGSRAEQAARNEGIDWKAISHALRAAYQVRELLTDNTITFPLKDAPFLMAVKAGKLDYMSEVVPVLEGLMDEVELLSEQSTLPDKVNRKYWDDFICEVMGNVYRD